MFVGKLRNWVDFVSVVAHALFLLGSGTGRNLPDVAWKWQSGSDCNEDDLRRAFECWDTIEATNQAADDIGLKDRISFETCCQTSRPRFACFDETYTPRRCCPCFTKSAQALAAAADLTEIFFDRLEVHPADLARAMRAASNASVGAPSALDLANTFLALATIRSIFDPSSPDIKTAPRIVGQLYSRMQLRRGLLSADPRGRVFNPFTAELQAEHVPAILAFPPFSGPAREGHILDFLGVSTDELFSCAGEKQIMALVPNRAFECLDHMEGNSTRWGPVLDEEYFEWAATLATARAAAARGDGFAMAEVGAWDYPVWATRAAVAFAELSDAPCDILVVEPFVLGDHSKLRGHLASNLPSGRCQISVVEEKVGKKAPAPRLADLLDRSMPRERQQPWDFVDIDAEGAELQVARRELGALAPRVRVLHVSTHSRPIHREVLGLLEVGGWRVQMEFAPYTAPQIGRYGPFATKDGHITALSPAHPGEPAALLAELGDGR